MNIAPIDSTYETIEIVQGTTEVNMTLSDVSPVYIGYYQDDDKTNYAGIYSTEKDPEFICYTNESEPKLYTPEDMVKFVLGDIDDSGTYKQVTRIIVKEDTTFTCRVYLKCGETLSSDYFLIKKTGATTSTTPDPTPVTTDITMHFIARDIKYQNPLNFNTTTLVYDSINVCICTNIDTTNNIPDNRTGVLSTTWESSSGAQQNVTLNDDYIYDYCYIEYKDVDIAAALGSITPSDIYIKSCTMQVMHNETLSTAYNHNNNDLYTNIEYLGNGMINIKMYNQNRFKNIGDVTADTTRDITINVEMVVTSR